MTDEELRQLVRASVERHLGQPTPPPPAAAQARVHSSHFHFAVPSGGDVEGPCLIEPTVHCNHCGYCQSQGH